jgi:hypothetical protein
MRLEDRSGANNLDVGLKYPESHVPVQHIPDLVFALMFFELTHRKTTFHFAEVQVRGNVEGPENCISHWQ